MMAISANAMASMQILFARLQILKCARDILQVFDCRAQNGFLSGIQPCILTYQHRLDRPSCIGNFLADFDFEATEYLVFFLIAGQGCFRGLLHGMGAFF